MSQNQSPREKAEAFLSVADQFRLGELPTEARHPRTQALSDLASSEVEQAIELLKDVELDALDSALGPKAKTIEVLEELQLEMKATLDSGGRVFFCGCGATGRLSLCIEVLWREAVQGSPRADQVRSFIAGGDYALVRSIENFEDHPEYGARQLRDLGFAENDLLVSTTEGGETPFVIGATEEAVSLSSRKPWFLFCNPSETLCARVERSRRIIENSRIRSLSLFTGPMAIAGSTRLQASTVLMLAAGSALMAANGGASLRERIDSFATTLARTDLATLAPLIRAEAEIYKSGRKCLHVTDHYAITVLTDTTERSPTFSLLPFENELDPETHCAWTYLKIPGARTSQAAWLNILKREPRPLDWPGFSERYGADVLNGFDFSGHGHAAAEKAATPIAPLSDRSRFLIDPQGSVIAFRFEPPASAQSPVSATSATLPRPKDLLTEHLLLKVAMNVSSTLVMGRLGRFSSNLMLYVKPTNKKLIDRSIRFVQMLLDDAGIKGFDYRAICYELFDVLQTLPAGDPAVLRTYQSLKSKFRNQNVSLLACPVVDGTKKLRQGA